MPVQLSTYLTAASVKIIDQIVLNQAARLALTGISATWKVKEFDTNKTWEYNGGTISNNANWTEITSTVDATAAIQSAINAMPYGGELQFPDGIVEVASTVTKSISPEQFYLKFKGTGRSVVQFKGVASTRFNLTGWRHFTMEDMIFMGDGSTASFIDATTAHIYLLCRFTTILRCAFLGLRSSGANGCVFVNGNLYANGIDLAGSGADVAGVITGTGFEDMILERVYAGDYGAWGGSGLDFGKNNYANFAWIYAKHGYLFDGSTEQVSANVKNRLKVSGATLDEGCDVAVYAENMRTVQLEAISNTTSQEKGIFWLKDVKNFYGNSLWAGWGTDRPVIGRLENVENAHIRKLVNQDNAVRILDLIGTPGEVELIRPELLTNGTYPIGINNAAGSRLRIDGVEYNGDKRAFGI